MNTPIIPTFLSRKNDNTFELMCEDPIYPDQSKLQEEEELNLMKKYAKIIEDRIKKDPTQWLMFREFWVE